MCPCHAMWLKCKKSFHFPDLQNIALLNGKTTSCTCKNVRNICELFQNARFSFPLIVVNLTLNFALSRWIKVQLIFSARMGNAMSVISAEILSHLDYEQLSGCLLTSSVNCNSEAFICRFAIMACLTVLILFADVNHAVSLLMWMCKVF